MKFYSSNIALLTMFIFLVLTQQSSLLGLYAQDNLDHLDHFDHFDHLHCLDCFDYIDYIDCLDCLESVISSHIWF